MLTHYIGGSKDGQIVETMLTSNQDETWIEAGEGERYRVGIHFGRRNFRDEPLFAVLWEEKKWVERALPLAAAQHRVQRILASRGIWNSTQFWKQIYGEQE